MNYYNYKVGTPKLVTQVNGILDNDEQTNEEKIRELLGLQFLRTQVGA